MFFRDRKIPTTSDQGTFQKHDRDIFIEASTRDLGASQTKVRYIALPTGFGTSDWKRSSGSTGTQEYHLIQWLLLSLLESALRLRHSLYVGYYSSRICSPLTRMIGPCCFGCPEEIARRSCWSSWKGILQGWL